MIKFSMRFLRTNDTSILDKPSKKFYENSADLILNSMMHKSEALLALTQFFKPQIKHTNKFSTDLRSRNTTRTRSLTYMSIFVIIGNTAWTP